MNQPNNFEWHMLLSAFSSLEEVCRKHSCSDCPLEPNDADPVCAYAVLKDRLKNLKEPMKESEDEE